MLKSCETHLPLTECGAVIDFVTACTLAHCHPTTVHTHLLQNQNRTFQATEDTIEHIVGVSKSYIEDDLCDVGAPLGLGVIWLLKRNMVLKRLTEATLQTKPHNQRQVFTIQTFLNALQCLTKVSITLLSFSRCQIKTTKFTFLHCDFFIKTQIVNVSVQLAKNHKLFISFYY